MRRIIALIIALLLVAAPAAAEEATDVVVTSSLCCLTPDAGPDTLTYSVMNTGETTVTGFEVEITLPPGMAGEPAVEVWVIDELGPGASADLVIALSPAVSVKGVTIEAVQTAPAAATASPSPLPAWLRIV